MNRTANNAGPASAAGDMDDLPSIGDDPVSRAPSRRLFSFSLKSLLLATLLVAVFLAGRASVQLPREPSALAGDWRMVLPAGFTYDCSLEWVRSNEYILRAPTGSAGVYCLDDDLLTMVEPGNLKGGQYAWQIVGDKLILVGQPNTGSNYIGATLTRRIAKP